MPRPSDGGFSQRESEIAYNSNNTSIDEMEIEGKAGGTTQNPISADAGSNAEEPGARDLVDV